MYPRSVIIYHFNRSAWRCLWNLYVLRSGGGVGPMGSVGSFFGRLSFFFVVKMQKAIQKRCKNVMKRSFLRIGFGLFYSFRINILLSLIKRKFNIKQFEVLLNFFSRNDLKRLITCTTGATGSLETIRSQSVKQFFNFILFRKVK